MSQELLKVPRTVAAGDIATNGWSFSAGMYQAVEMPTKNVRSVEELISSFHVGEDPGSAAYMRKSPAYLIRTKALQDYTCLLSSKGGSFVPVNPRQLPGVELRADDILMAKDSNVGECAILTKDLPLHSISGGIVRIDPSPEINRHYFFSFLKHEIFKTQLASMVPRGATIAHAKTLWLKCRVPFPNQRNCKAVIDYVAALTKAIINKELAIRDRNEEIAEIIERELSSGQTPERFIYVGPSSHDISGLGRLDAAIYSREYKERVWPVLNYRRGYETPKKAGFTITPGPSLEIKLLGTRVDSDVPRPGFYELLIPANISEWGTMSRNAWLGTKRKLPLLQSGDVLIGEAGFQKGRSIVLIEAPLRATTNAHGLYARRSDGDLVESIFFRCIFNWYRSQGLIDLMAVGGSGGHFSPEYFESIRIPKFPRRLREQIAALYHSPDVTAKRPTSSSYLLDSQRDSHLGIWQLDAELKELRAILSTAQHKIIHGEMVDLPRG